MRWTERIFDGTWTQRFCFCVYAAVFDSTMPQLFPLISELQSCFTTYRPEEAALLFTDSRRTTHMYLIMCLVNIAFFAKVLLLMYTSPVIGSSNCRPGASNDAWKVMIYCFYCVQKYTLGSLTTSYITSSFIEYFLLELFQFLETFKQCYIQYTTVDLHKICYSFDQIQVDSKTKEAVYSVTALSTDNNHAM